MARKTPIDKLGDAIQDIMEEYQDDIEVNLETITKKMGQKGAQALRQQSKQALKQHSGKYAQGWKHEFYKTSRSSKTTIHNEHYSLPHLLEHGHVTRNGTSRVSMNMMRPTPAHEHIAPVAESLTESFEREVLEKL